MTRISFLSLFFIFIIISFLLPTIRTIYNDATVEGCRPGKTASLLEAEICALCIAARPVKMHTRAKSIYYITSAVRENERETDGGSTGSATKEV